jgi:PAS domain S-box-containing protein
MKETSVFELPDFDPADLIESLADGVYITDVNRKIMYWNRAAERITGWSSAEVVGRSCYDDILGHIDKDGHVLCGQEHCPLHRSIVTGCASEAPVLVFARCKSGQRAPVEVTVAPLRSRNGETVGGIEVFRDATARVHDLLRAKSIQDLALQCGIGDDPCFQFEVCHEACDLVGGDFHRLERLADGRLVVLVADVMGHGVAAALYTMQLASLWDHHRADLGWPGRMLGIFNKHLHLMAGDAGFVATAVFTTYDPTSGDLCLARAGHPAPLIFRRDGGIDAVGKPQPALGMLPGLVYQECLARLEPGDDLLLFSDGAIEVTDAADRELGIEGLRQMVMEQRAADPGGTFRVAVLEEQLLRYSNEIHLPDDLTLLKLRRLQ